MADLCGLSLDRFQTAAGRLSRLVRHYSTLGKEGSAVTEGGTAYADALEAASQHPEGLLEVSASREGHFVMCMALSQIRALAPLVDLPDLIPIADMMMAHVTNGEGVDFVKDALEFQMVDEERQKAIIRRHGLLHRELMLADLSQEMGNINLDPTVCGGRAVEWRGGGDPVQITCIACGKSGRLRRYKWDLLPRDGGGNARLLTPEQHAEFIGDGESAE